MSDDLATVQYRTKGGQKAPVIIRTRGHRLEGVCRHAGRQCRKVSGRARDKDIERAELQALITDLQELSTRMGEAERVIETFSGTFGIPLIAVDAGERFLTKLEGVTDPELKRKRNNNSVLATRFRSRPRAGRTCSPSRSSIPPWGS